MGILLKRTCLSNLIFMSIMYFIDINLSVFTRFMQGTRLSFKHNAEMRRYRAYCRRMEECDSLMHLERVVGNLLNTVT